MAVICNLYGGQPYQDQDQVSWVSVAESLDNIAFQISVHTSHTGTNQNRTNVHGNYVPEATKFLFISSQYYARNPRRMLNTCIIDRGFTCFPRHPQQLCYPNSIPLPAMTQHPKYCCQSRN